MKFSVAKIEAALRASGGDMSAAARALYAATGVRAILDGDLRAAQLVLETQGRARGWTRRDPKVAAQTDPTRMTDEQLDAALAELETIARALNLTTDLEPVGEPSLPAPIKRPRD